MIIFFLHYYVATIVMCFCNKLPLNLVKLCSILILLFVIQNYAFCWHVQMMSGLAFLMEICLANLILICADLKTCIYFAHYSFQMYFFLDKKFKICCCFFLLRNLFKSGVLNYIPRSSGDFPAKFSNKPNQIHLTQCNCRRPVCCSRVGTELYRKVDLQEHE